MRLLPVLVVLAGCPAPAPPPVERPPPPPPVVVIDAAPEPEPPAVLAVRSAGGGVLELVRVDVTGDARVIVALERASALPRVADLALDPATGRYAMLVEADTVGGVKTRTPKNVMTLVLGALDGEPVAVGPGDKKCVMHKCFESAVAIPPGGDAVVTTLLRSGASDLARYEFGASPSPARLTAKGVVRPAVSPDHARYAYGKAGAIHVAGLDGAGKPTAVVTGKPDLAALALGDTHLVYRTGNGAVVVVDVETADARTVAELAADPRPALRIAGGEVFTTDVGSVFAIPIDGSAPRLVATGALIDVSADGAWVLVDDDALVIVRASDGEVAARLDVPAAFGEVRARLAP